MLHALSSLPKLSLRALDGEIGSVKDSYFDDQRWVLRYIVVDTGGWLPGREVLISPYSVSGIDWEREREPYFERVLEHLGHELPDRLVVGAATGRAVGASSKHCV